jgi:hypothetical protein
MTIFPMMRGGAIALVFATASLVQGCGSFGTATPVPQQASLPHWGPDTGFYSGTAWYADLNNVMTTDSGGE